MRLGPVRITYWCDGCSQIQHFQGGTIGCKETGKSLHALSSEHLSIRKSVVIPTPQNCPYLLKNQRKDKLDEINGK